MPWRNTCSKEQRDRLLSEWVSRDVSRAALCELFGISRQTGYKWVRRYRKERSVEEHSRRPKTNPNTTPARLVKLILSQRKQFPLWGPVPIRKRLQTHWPHYDWPAVSTIGAILKRHGMVKARRTRYRVPPRTQPFSHCREPNDVWCVDFKGQFATGDGRLCYPLTVMDAASRYLLACVAFHHPTLENVRAVFVELFKKHGLPKAVRSDNGEPFASASAAAGLTQLSAWWARLGIQLERIDPGKPQQNGRHERMHLTLKQATCSPPKKSLWWQQRAFERFRTHDPLPALHYPFADVHRVRPDGTIRLNQRRQFISTSLAGELIGLHTLDERYVQVLYADVVLGLIDRGNVNAKEGLIRPRVDLRKHRSTKIPAAKNARSGLGPRKSRVAKMRTRQRSKPGTLLTNTPNRRHR